MTFVTVGSYRVLDGLFMLVQGSLQEALEDVWVVHQVFVELVIFGVEEEAIIVIEGGSLERSMNQVRICLWGE